MIEALAFGYSEPIHFQLVKGQVSLFVEHCANCQINNNRTIARCILDKYDRFALVGQERLLTLFQGP
jgi:hypothetical protein